MAKNNTKLKHLNTGFCFKCDQLFKLYPDFHRGLRDWFFEKIQASNPDAHISCAGRGRVLQEQYFKQGTTNAHYGQSAHNYNLALDIFRQTLNGAEYGPTWFRNIVGQAVEIHNKLSPAPSFKIKWYGDPDSRYYELPHCEVDGWRDLPRKSLVEK